LLQEQIDGKFKIGIRIAAEEEPKFEFYTSRLGIGYKDIVPFYRKQIQDNKKVELKIAERIFHGSLHIFVGFKHVHFTLRIQGLRILLLLHWETATVSELG